MVLKRLQIGTDMLLIITSTIDRLSILLTSMTLNDLEPLPMGVLVIFCNFLAAAHIPTLNFECDEMAGDRPTDNLQKKVSALNVDFSSLSPDPLGSRKPAQANVKDGCPPKKWLFYRNYLV